MYTNLFGKIFLQYDLLAAAVQQSFQTSLLQKNISEIRFDYFYCKDKLNFCFLNKTPFQEKLFNSNYFIYNYNAVLTMM